MRVLSLWAVCLLFASASYAQGSNASASATQSVQLVLNPTIDIRFSNTNTATGSTISMLFDNINHYTDGVLSGTQELEVRSNKNFKISVKTDAPTFTYTGGQSNASMPVNNRLFLAVTSNNTGGSLASGFDNYTSLSATNQDMILDGIRGDEKKFVLVYKAKPDMGYPAGTYSVGVLYTATQP